MDDEELISHYQARGIPTDWQDVTPDVMRSGDAFRLYFRALPSPSMQVAGSDEAELLIHDPLTALREARISSADGEARILAPDGDVPSISTFVVNHEKTLNRFVMYASVAVSTNPHTVGITIVKEAEPKDGQEASEEAEPPQPSW
jgi:hypothetical protein